MSQSLLELAQDFGSLASSAGELSQQVPGVRAAMKGFCRIVAGTPGPAILGALNIGTVCDPYLSEDGRGFGSTAPPPFTGGQCPGVTYNVTADLVRNGQLSSTNPQTGSGPGPITQYTEQRGDGGPSIGFRDRDGNAIISHGFPDGNTASYTNVSVVRADGQPDDCGDPPGEFTPGDGYGGEDYNQPQVVTGPDGQDYNITVGPPSTGPNGDISIPVNIDGIDLNLGSPSGDGGAPARPDYNNPTNPESPGPGGGSDGGDNPPDGIDSDTPVGAVTVFVTTTPVNFSREVGGPENILIEGVKSDAGWFRWKIAGAFSEPQRLVSESNHFVFSPGNCTETEGFQVKFSPGYSGLATTFQCSTTED